MLVSWCQLASGQVPPQPPVVTRPAVIPPSSLAIGDQYFDADLDGFREYLESVRDQDIALYRTLDPQLRSLEEQRTTGSIVSVSSLIVGVGVLAWGVVTLVTAPGVGECDVGSPDHARCLDEKRDENSKQTSRGLVLMGLGVLLGGGGILLGEGMKPGRKDFLSLVNAHNRAKPSNPMRLQLGFDPVGQRAYAGIGLELDFVPTH